MMSPLAQILCEQNAIDQNIDILVSPLEKLFRLRKKCLGADSSEA